MFVGHIRDCQSCPWYCCTGDMNRTVQKPCQQQSRTTSPQNYNNTSRRLEISFPLELIYLFCGQECLRVVLGLDQGLPQLQGEHLFCHITSRNVITLSTIVAYCKVRNALSRFCRSFPRRSGMGRGGWPPPATTYYSKSEGILPSDNSGFVKVHSSCAFP